MDIITFQLGDARLQITALSATLSTSQAFVLVPSDRNDISSFKETLSLGNAPPSGGSLPFQTSTTSPRISIAHKEQQHDADSTWSVEAVLPSIRLCLNQESVDHLTSFAGRASQEIPLRAKVDISLDITDCEFLQMFILFGTGRSSKAVEQ